MRDTCTQKKKQEQINMSFIYFSTL